MSDTGVAASLLREARRRAGITQGALGERAGVSQSVISAYESSARQPSLPTLTRLVRATGHELDLELVSVTMASPANLTPLSGPVGRRVVRHRRDLTETLERHGVTDARIFGSVARGDDRPDSDVDLLVTLPPGSGLFALGRLVADLERILGAAFDVVPEDAVKPDVRLAVERDALPL